MNELAVLLGVGLSTLTILGYLAVIWWLDRYEREPWWLVAVTFAWGATGGMCFGALLSVVPAIIAMQTLGEESGMALSVVAIAPVSEELTKALIFIPLVLTRHVDNETDGLIYGAATGLGFAGIENLVYFLTAESPEALVTMIILRTLFTSLVHCIASALLGMMIGYVRHRAGVMRRVLMVALGYGMAIVCHGTWNGLAAVVMLNSGRTGAVLFLVLGCLLVAGASVVMFAITMWSLKREHDVIRAWLQREADLGYIPAEHVGIIPYWTRRRRSGWLDPRVPRGAYVRLATLLAFRHHQLEIADDRRREKYLADIQRFRAEIRLMLSRDPTRG